MCACIPSPRFGVPHVHAYPKRAVCLRANSALVSAVRRRRQYFQRVISVTSPTTDTTPLGQRIAALALAPNLVEAHINVGFHHELWLDPTDSEPIDLPAPRARKCCVSVLQHCTNWHFRCTLRCLCLRRCSYLDTTTVLLTVIPTITELRIIVAESDYTAEHFMEPLTVNAMAPAPFAHIPRHHARCL
ncbi:hypothetical protein MSAN_02076700 [Mycena sanguinolenta]|uniref:Uncharacterized protein n=1 Tax=Mycena sanguinolenta TaxID=230812 RepID=A0A8H7CMP3_9AGAR|nr:hypothetical protein MSAN_02076700 [Mycena sanguinolenta]